MIYMFSRFVEINFKRATSPSSTTDEIVENSEHEKVRASSFFFFF